MSRLPIITFYTSGTYYEEEVKGLIKSAQQFQHPIHAVSRPSLNNWNLNCHIKPFFILEEL